MVRIIVILWCVVVAAGCADQPSLVFLTRDGCVNTVTMRANLDDALRSMGLASNYQVIDLATLGATDARGGYPTPTVLHANKDIFGMAEPRPPYAPPT
jgi:hypothetical protein